MKTDAAMYPDDLHPIVKKVGTRFIAQYRTPWGVRTVMEGERPKTFDSNEKAFKEATGALLTEFRDKSTGWCETPVSAAREAAEALFRRPAGGQG